MIDFEKAFIDTAPFIYYIEGSKSNPKYSYKMKGFFRDSYENGKSLVTSVITIEEYNVFPYRMNNQELLYTFERLISALNMEIVNVDRSIAEKAAHIRAEYKDFKAMDALQLSTACIMGCDLFLSNDKQLRQFKEIQCVTVDEL